MLYKGDSTANNIALDLGDTNLSTLTDLVTLSAYDPANRSRPLSSSALSERMSASLVKTGDDAFALRIRAFSGIRPAFISYHLPAEHFINVVA